MGHGRTNRPRNGSCCLKIAGCSHILLASGAAHLVINPIKYLTFFVYSLHCRNSLYSRQSLSVDATLQASDSHVTSRRLRYCVVTVDKLFTPNPMSYDNMHYLGKIGQYVIFSLLRAFSTHAGKSSP